MYFLWTALKIIINAGIIYIIFGNYKKIINQIIDEVNKEEIKKDDKIYLTTIILVFFFIFLASLIENIYFSFRLLHIS